jgi:hypothetical protein
MLDGSGRVTRGGDRPRFDHGLHRGHPVRTLRVHADPQDDRGVEALCAGWIPDVDHVHRKRLTMSMFRILEQASTSSHWNTRSLWINCL